MTARVVLVDDQRTVREGLSALLELLDDVAVVGLAADGVEALEVVARTEPDVVLMDLRMPRLDGVAATALLRQQHPSVAVVVLTTYADDESVFGALRAGARGYLTKDAGAAEIQRAIALVREGRALLDPSVQARLLAVLDQAPGLVPTSPPAALTGREAEVLQLVAKGLSNGDIAARLVVTEATVKTHINRVFAKTGVRDRAQAVAYAYEHGLVRR